MKQAALATVGLFSLWLGAGGPAAAGTVSTGGGVLYEDQANPWFLENTKTVTYCLEVDTEHVHLAPERIAAHVQSALTAWKLALTARANNQDLDPGLVPYGQVRLATQDFREEPCREATDLRFQFGTLGESQRRLLPNPTHFVATTVRTSYDEVNLRGRGFIYISPDSGPLRPDAVSFATSPWSVCDGCVLKRALLHELGHVFGLSHGGGNDDLMGARHLEVMTTQSVVDALADAKKTPADFEDTFGSVDLFRFPAKFTDRECSSGQPWGPLNTFFHIPSTWSCVHLVMSADSGPMLQVYAAKDKDSPLQLIGTSSIQGGEGVGTQYSSDDLVLVKLNPRQKVFTSTPLHDPNGYLAGPTQVYRETRSFIYRTVGSDYSTPVLLNLRPNHHFEVIGTVNGLLDQVISN